MDGLSQHATWSQVDFISYHIAPTSITRSFMSSNIECRHELQMPNKVQTQGTFFIDMHEITIEALTSV